MDKRSFATAYRILVEDLLTLCEYIDPRDANRACFSHRTFELLLRSCTELENLWKSFLLNKQHGGDPNDWNVHDYAKIESQYGIELSSVEVAFVHWNDGPGLSYFLPYDGWTDQTQKPRLKWYKAYNAVKHARENNFPEASLDYVISAIGALHIALDKIFGGEAFFPQPIPGVLKQTRLGQTFLHFDIKR